LAVLSAAYYASPEGDYRVIASFQLSDDANIKYEFYQKHWEQSCPSAAQITQSALAQTCDNCEVKAGAQRAAFMMGHNQGFILLH